MPSKLNKSFETFYENVRVSNVPEGVSVDEQALKQSLKRIFSAGYECAILDASEALGEITNGNPIIGACRLQVLALGLNS